MSRKNAERNGGERATILEQEGGWAVVLTRDGEFRRLRLPAGRAWQVGDELALPEPAGAGRGGRRRLWAAAAVAAALLLVVLGTLSPWSRPTAWAYVSLDWHGGVEFTTDRDGRVIDARAFSTAGAELLRDVAWRGRPIDQVLAQAAEKEIQDARTGNDAASAQGKASPAGQPPTPVLVGIAPARQGASPDRVEKRVRSGAERLQGLLQSQAADVPVMLLRVEGSLAADRDRVQSVGASQAWAEAQRHLPGVRVEPGWAALFRQLLSQGLDPQRTIGGQLLQGVLPKEGGAPSGKEGREAPATGPAAQAGLPAGAAGSTRSGHPGEEGGTGQPGGSAETGAAHPLPPPVGKPPQGADAAGKAPFEPGRSRGEPASVRGPSSGRTEKGGTGLPSLPRQGCQPRLEGARQLVGSCPEAEPRPGGKVAPPQGGREEAGAPQRSRSGDASWKGLLDRLGSLGRQLEGLLGAPGGD
ncbi:MAG: hypothetical protein QJR14_00200 [Bacillota bacterium]|nr:hypothetical protein [Bacillota bacterium]